MQLIDDKFLIINKLFLLIDNILVFDQLLLPHVHLHGSPLPHHTPLQISLRVHEHIHIGTRGLRTGPRRILLQILYFLMQGRYCVLQFRLFPAVDF